MKRLLITACAACTLLALPTLAAEETDSQSTKVDFGTFSPSEDGTFVEIKVSKGLINMAARITQDSEPELAKILSGLKSVRVNVVEFDENEGKEIQSRVQSIRSQLDEQQWERVVTVKENEEDVGIYVKLKEEESIEGLVVTVISGNEAILVHVDGSIRPEELAQVGERLNLPPLERIGEMLGE